MGRIGCGHVVAESCAMVGEESEKIASKDLKKKSLAFKLKFLGERSGKRELTVFHEGEDD